MIVIGFAGGGRFAPAEMEASEYNHGLGHLDLDAIHFFIEGRQCESSMDGNFASLGYCFEDAVAEPVPCAYVEPQSFVLIGIRGELFHRHGEFNDLVSSVFK